MKKYTSIFLSLLLIFFVGYGCSQQDDQYSDAVLILEQYPNENTPDAVKLGIIYAECKMVWRENLVDSVQITATFEDKDHANAMYQSLVADGIGTEIADTVVRYTISPDLMRAAQTTYQDALEMYENDRFQTWTIKQKYVP